VGEGGGELDLVQKQIELYHFSLRRTQRHLAEYNRKNTFIFIVIYDEMESNWVQIYNYTNEHKCTTHVYEPTTYIYTC
jgi:hypothetical protein